MAYFKLKVKSETGKKVEEIFRRAEDVQAKRIAFMKKVGANKGHARGDLLSGISGLFFDDEPDRKEWKYYDKAKGLYLPRKNAKIRKEWDAIGKVQRNEIDKAIGNLNWMSTRCGFCESESKEYFLIDINMEPKFKHAPMDLTDDCIEIVTAEYKGLKGDR